ncbi:MAG: thiamine phosphate synthase [Pseudomonadota bacterium]
MMAGMTAGTTPGINPRTALNIRLYGIIDPLRCQGRDIVPLVKQAAAGGITLLQYRDKTADTRTLVENARAIKQALTGTGIPVLMNDRVDVALAAKLDGVHIGQSDMTPADARRLLGADAIIGLTVKTADQAKVAPLDIIDYACIGGVHATLSKDNPSAIGLEGWVERAAPLRARDPSFPVGAIAGIDETNAADVMAAGADGVAIISGMFMQDDVEAATANLKAILEGATQ